MAQPLHSLTRKCSRFPWTEKCHKAFEQLKRRLALVPKLYNTLNGGDLILDMGAIDFIINTVLSQIKNNEEHVLTYRRC